MADVDICVRYCEKALSGDIARYAKMMAELPNSKRVTIFSNKTASEIGDILLNCKKSIQIKISNDFYGGVGFESVDLSMGSSNNKIGADLLHKLPSGEVVDIEVKFGMETDKQIGMAQFEKIFGTDAFSKALSMPARKSWIDSYMVEDSPESSQFYRLFKKLNEAIASFNRFSESKNYTLLAAEQSHMESLIINNSGNHTKTGDHYLKFVIDGSNMRDVKELPTGLGRWTIDEVKPLSDSVKRVNIFVTNKTTHIQIKYTLNWKNNYKIPGVGKVPAKLGLGSPSWNVWVSIEVIEL